MNPPAIVIPRVELLEELGRGSHSVVFRARREGRYYAVKLPLYAEDGAKARQLGDRFLREAIALARVRHPALPTVMEVGAAGHVPYIIMELGTGETLSVRLQRGPLNEEQAIRLARQLADALVAIHQSGLVHRDIKPKNILFDPQTTAIRLVDFGFAASADARAGSDGPTGTLAYMAPEQRNGLRERVDSRADLYSLGCVLFEVVTGSPPVPDVDPRRLLRRHTGRGSSDVNTAEPRVSRAFAGVVEWLLARDPDERCPSAIALIRELDRIEAGRGGRRSRQSAQSAALIQVGPLVPLLGRSHELDRMRSAWADVHTSGAKIAWVSGQAGAGKTRLVHALLEETGAEPKVRLVATCKEADPQPFAAVRQLVESYLSTIEALSGGQRLRTLDSLRRLAGDTAPLLGILSPMFARALEDDAPVPRFDDVEHVYAEGLAAFLVRLLGEIEPAALFVDNVHWIDSGSRRVLARVADRLANRKVLAIFATRRGLQDPEAPDKLYKAMSADSLIEIGIGALPAESTQALVQAYLGPAKVDAELLQRIASLSDGSPLSTLEVLRAMLDAAALVPHWGTWRLDREALARMKLTRETVSILVQRMSTLDELTGRTLRAAAVLGTEFDDDVLRRASSSEEGHVNAALADGRRALLIEAAPRGRHRFVHDAVREALLCNLDENELRALNQTLAEALDAIGVRRVVPDASVGGTLNEQGSALFEQLLLPKDRESSDFDRRFALAAHYAAGQIDKNAQRVFDTNVEAAKLAFRAFDDERALGFLSAARRAAEVSGAEFSPEIESLSAELLLRVGAFDQSLAHFRHVVQIAPDPLLKALSLSRIAWIQMQLDFDAAWDALGSAFAILGERRPASSIFGLIVSLWLWAWGRLFRKGPIANAREKSRIETLCALYYQAGRLAFQSSKALVLIDVALRCQGPAERLGQSPALTKSYLMTSFVLTALGARRAGRRYLEAAQSIAAATRDPVVQAHALQVHSAIAAWAGDLRDSLQAARRSLGEFGHWRELSEFCITAYNHQQIECLRGRNFDAWHWMEQAVQRINQYERPPLALEYIEIAARATLASLGRKAEADRALGRLRTATLAGSKWPLSVSVLGARVRMFTETGRLDADFETLVAEVKKAGHDPRRVHMEVTEYYVHVAHARVHAVLTAPEFERQKRVETLREALHDLERAARIPLLVAHCRIIQAHYAWFSARAKQAHRLFAEAERLGEKEGAPWVLYAVHRGRAHMLRSLGHEDEARDRAKLAETLALEHGAAHRLRWIREEFSLRGTRRRASDASSSDPLSPVEPLSASMSVRSLSSQHLRSLTRIAEARPEELTPEQQSRSVLDEIVEALHAERGILLFLTGSMQRDGDGDDGSRLRVLVARSSSREDLPAELSFDRDMVEGVLRSGLAELGDEAPGPAAARGGRISDQRRSMIAAPVLVQHTAIGVVYLDRPLTNGAFEEADAERLFGLASQVPVALELARSLHSRERAFENLRTAQKMEALSKLAGGVAHDFNNMLTVIFTLTESILAAKSRNVQADVSTIRSAAERARELTNQLLALSRGQFLSPRVVQLNDLIQRLEPTLRAVLASGVEMEVKIDPELYPVKVDPAQFEQVLTNLALNAGDAMVGGGRLIIETRNAKLDDEYVRLHPGVVGGPYAELRISDTGEGIDAATRQRIFEPFFTTKRQGKGTGLGLAMVYGIVTQSGGHIDVESNVGIGSVFRVYLPRAKQSHGAEPELPEEVDVQRGAETIMVVDDEPMVRESLGRMLNRLGYTVLFAAGGEEALSIAGTRLGEIGLVITDVLMPRMNGLELARELSRLSPELKVLFVSGYTDGVLAERGILRERVDFLQKPLALATLARRVREVLDQQ